MEDPFHIALKVTVDQPTTPTMRSLPPQWVPRPTWNKLSLTKQNDKNSTINPRIIRLKDIHNIAVCALGLQCEMNISFQCVTCLNLVV